MNLFRIRDAFLAGLFLSSACAAAACTSTVREFESGGSSGSTGGSGGAGSGSSGSTGGSGGVGATGGAGGVGGTGGGIGGTGGTGGVMCVGETDFELCALKGFECGPYEATDKCGVARSVNCKDCTLPNICGGAGEANHCGAHPKLTGLDGYILQNGSMGGSYKLTFATDGVASAGGFCCGNTIEEARNYYPNKNLLFLPPPVNVVAMEIPPLKGVDGYVIPSAAMPGTFEVLFAKDGALDGGGFCCSNTLDEAKAAYPTLNLGYLPYYPM